MSDRQFLLIATVHAEVSCYFKDDRQFGYYRFSLHDSSTCENNYCDSTISNFNIIKQGWRCATGIWWSARGFPHVYHNSSHISVSSTGLYQSKLVYFRGKSVVHFLLTKITIMIMYKNAFNAYTEYLHRLSWLWYYKN